SGHKKVGILSDIHCPYHSIEALSLAITDLKNTTLFDMANDIHQFKVTVNGSEGYQKAEVTVGGVDTDELSSKTMESNKVPGLFFIGEVVDVTGWLGGYNFQWAWSSAFVCANAIAHLKS
ncbi:MAG: hypothetical protein EBV46_06500, partial [Burkholderiaceae bacterium]|nr:hypothetical protein [Burkholderiaceae bacterium]